MNNTCCLDCKERHYNCHSECEKYKKFRQELEMLNKDKLKNIGYQRSSSHLSSIRRKLLRRK